MTTARPIPSARRGRHAPMLLAVSLALILAACGGGGGGGGDGASAFKLRAATVNESAGDATVTFEVAGEPGEPQTLETCRGKVFTFDLPVDEEWTMSINGQIAIDSTAMDENLRERNLIAQVTLKEDGAVEQESLSVGALVGPPAQSGICL